MDKLPSSSEEGVVSLSWSSSSSSSDIPGSMEGRAGTSMAGRMSFLGMVGGGEVDTCEERKRRQQVTVVERKNGDVVGQMSNTLVPRRFQGV